MNNRGHCLTSFDTGLHSWAGCSLPWPASGWRAPYRSKFLRLSRDSRPRFRRAGRCLLGILAGIPRVIGRAKQASGAGATIAAA